MCKIIDSSVKRVGGAWAQATFDPPEPKNIIITLVIFELYYLFIILNKSSSLLILG